MNARPRTRTLYIVTPIFVSGDAREYSSHFIVDGFTARDAADAAINCLHVGCMLLVKHIEIEVNLFAEMKETIGLSINRAAPPLGVFEMKRDADGRWWTDGVRPVVAS